MVALLAQALARGYSFRVPAGVVAQAWRDGRRHVSLSRFLTTREVQIVPLDEHLARACGELCGFAGTSDVIDASVVLVARERDDVIVTSDADDLSRLDARASIVQI